MSRALVGSLDNYVGALAAQGTSFQGVPLARQLLVMNVPPRRGLAR